MSFDYVLFEEVSMLSYRLGKVGVEPADPVAVGSVGQWTFFCTVGSFGIDEGETIKVAQRYASVWKEPHFTLLEEPGYTAVWTDSDARRSMYLFYIKEKLEQRNFTRI